MFKYILVLALIAAVSAHAVRKHKPEDPFAALDHHISHTLAYHYLWPWSQLVRAAAALEDEDYLEEPHVISTPDKFEVNLSVKRFNPDELKIKVKNRYIIVEGTHEKTKKDTRFMANHFVQQFVLPPGSKQEEVTAVYKENRVLTISAPKHELPPPPPERDVPIEVRLPEQKTEGPEKVETMTEKKAEEPIQTTTSPLDQLELAEATTHAGKIRKKELKTTTKTTKDNEVAKGFENNGLDYALVDSELE